MKIIRLWDNDNNKIRLLNNGSSYIHEIGLTDLINEQIGKNLSVSNELPIDGDVYVISVGTPVKNDANGILLHQTSISPIQLFIQITFLYRGLGLSFHISTQYCSQGVWSEQMIEL